ncbi:MAG: WecB/TagA/CpsF family glycosyltransferase [Akkermansiaceae bacterium]|jgi:N-acetylglucosaminyldiphosphoundecaprenol N-acetyl-beta-D-mannosaminyltransferase|nr:WecB/TagA/CpsF family glycosyltransferase [Akkermansiaceae bacterium]
MTVMNATHSEPPMTVLLGLPFHDTTLEETLDFCREAMKGGESRYLVTANVDFTTQAYADADLRKIVFFADRVVCDGMPLVWLSKVFGQALRERVAGSDMVPRLLEICGREGLPVYFFGSDLETLIEAKKIAEERYPGLQVVGVDSPPFGAVIEWDNEALCERMRASGAKLLLACLGCPKQERWIYAHHRECGIPLSIGVGASLDFITGKQKRAPRWMQKTGLEWFWRMAGNPSRLAKRYGHDLVFLVRAALVQAWSQRRRGALELAQLNPPPLRPAALQVTRLIWAGELRKSELEGAPLPELVDKAVFLDASRVAFIDSSGLGRLALLIRMCRVAGKDLFVVQPSAVFRGALEDSRMSSLVTMLDSDVEAMERLRTAGQAVARREAKPGGEIWVAFDRALDAVYHDEMIASLESAVAEAGEGGVLVLDLSKVGFIDSRAVGGLIRIWKKMSAQGGGMFLAHPSAEVREIIGLLRLDKVLPEWKGEHVS